MVPPVIAMEEIQIRRSVRSDIAAGKTPVWLVSCWEASKNWLLTATVARIAL